MNLRHVSKYALLAFVAASLAYWGYTEVRGGSPAGEAAPASSGAAATRKVTAYYFHGKVRCQSCVNIERFSREAINEGFPNELAGGLLEFRDVVVQEPGNEHYMDDYQLSSWALVLVEYRNGKQTRWKNVDKVWEYVLGDPASFHDYVKKEVRDFLAAEG